MNPDILESFSSFRFTVRMLKKFLFPLCYMNIIDVLGDERNKQMYMENNLCYRNDYVEVIEEQIYI